MFTYAHTFFVFFFFTFCAYSEKGQYFNYTVCTANDHAYSTVVHIYMQLCPYSDYFPYRLTIVLYVAKLL